MTRVRAVMLGLLAVLAVGAVASASASANTREYFIKKTAVGGGGEAIAGTVGTAKLNGELLGKKTEIECTTNTLSEGKIEAAGASKGKVSFEGCGDIFTYSKGVRTAQAACPITVPIEFNFKDKLYIGPGGVDEDEFYTGGGINSAFVEIGIGGTTCALKGTYAVKGVKIKTGEYAEPFYDASLPNGELEQVKHSIVFTSMGSHITFGGNPASFTDEDVVELAGVETGEKWYVE